VPFNEAKLLSVLNEERKAKDLTPIESKEESVVAVYKQHPDAENAVNLLKKNSFNIKHVAVVGQSDQTKEHLTAYYSTGERMIHWGKNGAFWSGMFVLLAGSAVFAIPGVGLVMVASFQGDPIDARFLITEQSPDAPHTSDIEASDLGGWSARIGDRLSFLTVGTAEQVS
jgi:hypothetical protein